MKKIFKYVIVAFVLALPVISLAMEFRAGEQLSVGKDKIIKDDVYMTGGSVVNAGSVTGDLFAAGGNIIISGDVGADAVVVGGNISILSNVGDDLRVGGGTVVITGKVEGDLMAGGGQVTISGSGAGGDAAIAGGVVHLNAPITGDLFVGAGEVYINASVGGDVKIEAEKVTLGSNAVISGNLTYKAKTELVKETGAVVKGETTFTPIKGRVSKASAKAIISGFLLWKFLSLLACSLLLGLIFRRYSREVAGLAVGRPFLELGRGLIVLIAFPVISILFFVTIVGIPLGFLGLVSFAALMLFVCIMTPIIVGSVVYRFFSKKDLEVSWKTILLGVVLYSLVGLVPFIGGLVKFLLMLLVLGSLVTLKWRIVKEWR